MNFINTDNFTDARAATGHLGFMLLVVLGLLSKDEVEGAYSIATIFIAVAIPSLILSLIFMPKGEALSQLGMGISVISNLLGHFCGVGALSSVLFGMSALAGCVFFVMAMLAYGVFAYMAFRHVGGEKLFAAQDSLFKRSPNPNETVEKEQLKSS